MSLQLRTKDTADNGASDEKGVYIALGGNMPFEGLEGGRLFEKVLNVIDRSGFKPIRVSRVWSSPAWPDRSTPAFANAVAELAPDEADAQDLLMQLLKIEERFGRIRKEVNGPRTLDLDLIDFCGRVWVDKDPAGLTIPHLRAHERSFVMGPLQEIAPQWRHPVLEAPVSELFESALAVWPAEKRDPIPAFSQAPQNSVELAGRLD
ncbi:MAG: 2-amino-4-hydroxy-6-hydroxymethyldihydropteridine diphosphokinase [Pseudomonadota bacterium]